MTNRGDSRRSLGARVVDSRRLRPLSAGTAFDGLQVDGFPATGQGLNVPPDVPVGSTGLLEWLLAEAKWRNEIYLDALLQVRDGVGDGWDPAVDAPLLARAVINRATEL